VTGTSVRFGTWNLGNGGTDGPDETRRQTQPDILNGLDLDVLAIQELTGWETQDWWRLYDFAQRLGLTPLPPVTSRVGDQHNHFALLYRSSRVRVLAYNPAVSEGRFHHGLARARVENGGRELMVLATHLAYTTGETRLGEAGLMTDYAGPFPGRPRDAVLLGDLNCPSNDDPEPDWNRVPPNLHPRYRIIREDGTFGPADRRALRALLGAGWTDPQTLVGEPRAATVGYWYENEPVPLCDRITGIGLT
jgi:endonuclease/exonuclease/phosphatase family metal-dependent hydrolase